MPSSKPFQWVVKIDPAYTAAEREAIAQDMIEMMRERAKEGMGVSKDGDSVRRKKFPGYSDSYAHSLDFKIAGKKKGDVNLTLSGDMLGAMDLVKHKKGELVIGFEAGTQEAEIAEGNILGTYGQSTPNPSRARDFLGLTPREIAQVLRSFPLDDQTARDEASEIHQAAKRTAGQTKAKSEASDE